MKPDDKNVRDNNSDTAKEIDFNGGAIIDARGREIAITEDMIQNAFEKLAQVSMLPSKLCPGK